jgi:outer membrane murein-binding lipoprotein Lpp
MKQFLLLLGVAAVAGAMYVAGASGSQQAKFAPEKQVVALQKKVAALSKTLKTVKSEADFATTYELTCLATVSGNTITVNLMPVSQFGNGTSGFLFGSSGSSTPRTALDVNQTNPTDVLQEFNPACLSGALRHGVVNSGVSRLHLRMAKNTR